MEWLNVVADKGLQEVRTHQPSSQQLLNDVTQGLYPVEVLPSHTVPPLGFRDRAANHEHRERRVDDIPQIEPYFPPHDRRVRQWEVKVGISSRPRSYKDVHIAQGYHFCT
jgi:hypothetical protein